MPHPRELGFALTLRQGRRSALVALLAGLAFGVWMALADALLFAGAIPATQHEAVRTVPLFDRLAWHARGVLFDEAVFRLICVTGLAWLIAAASGRRGAWIAWTAIMLAALVIYPLGTPSYFRTLDWTALTVARELALHGAAGVLWGWLYWRHGWLAGVLGHMAAHLALQPLLGALA